MIVFKRSIYVIPCHVKSIFKGLAQLSNHLNAFPTYIFMYICTTYVSENYFRSTLSLHRLNFPPHFASIRRPFRASTSYQGFQGSFALPHVEL